MVNRIAINAQQQSCFGSDNIDYKVLNYFFDFVFRDFRRPKDISRLSDGCLLV